MAKIYSQFRGYYGFIVITFAKVSTGRANCELCEHGNTTSYLPEIAVCRQRTVSQRYCYSVAETIKPDKRQTQSRTKQASKLRQKKKEEGRKEGRVKWGRKNRQGEDRRKHKK